MEDLTTDAAALRKMSQFGGWCAFLTEGTRICHIRRYINSPGLEMPEVQTLAV